MMDAKRQERIQSLLRRATRHIVQGNERSYAEGVKKWRERVILFEKRFVDGLNFDPIVVPLEMRASLEPLLLDYAVWNYDMRRDEFDVDDTDQERIAAMLLRGRCDRWRGYAVTVTVRPAQVWLDGVAYSVPDDKNEMVLGFPSNDTIRATIYIYRLSSRVVVLAGDVDDGRCIQARQREIEHAAFRAIEAGEGQRSIVGPKEREQ
jgi:hypothetical protein